MFKDPQFLMTFQLAFNGIVLVVGLFFVWKGLSRVEEKLDMILLEKQQYALNPFKLQLDNSGLHIHQGSDSNECLKEMMNDERMKEVFDENVAQDFVLFSSPFTVPDGEDHQEAAPIEEPKIEEVKEAAPSEISDIHGPLSKNKLRHLNLDKLRLICEERGLSSEGTKNTLIERILQSS